MVKNQIIIIFSPLFTSPIEKVVDTTKKVRLPVSDTQQPHSLSFDNLLAKEFAKVTIHVEQIRLFAYHLTHEEPILLCDYLGL